MRKIPRATYQTPDELHGIIALRRAEAFTLPPGPARQSILIEVAKLQAYADMKRRVATPTSDKKTEPAQ